MTKATVPIIHALFVKTQWQVLHPTVLIWPPTKIATSAVGLSVVSRMVRLAQTVFLRAMLGTGIPATAAPTAAEMNSASNKTVTVVKEALASKDLTCVPISMIRCVDAMVELIQMHVWLPPMGGQLSGTWVNVMVMMTTQMTGLMMALIGVNAGATAIVERMSSVAFQKETVVTLKGENASPSLLGPIVLALQIMQSAAVTT